MKGNTMIRHRISLVPLAAILLVSAAARFAVAAEADKRPNIIFILTDQQSAHMMSCTGNKWLKTPAMDYIANSGIRFERAYTTNPVCSPARIGCMTGRFPGYFKSNRRGPVRENRSGMAVDSLPDEAQNTHIAAYLKKAGYRLAYSGKQHLPRPLTPNTLGFAVLGGDSRGETAEVCAQFVKQKHERPYFLWINFINPHDICYFAINDFRFDSPKRTGAGGVANKMLVKAMQLPEGVSEETFLAEHCPPLPANYLPQEDEPVAITQLIETRSFRKRARDTYTDNDWRFHRWAYHRLTEMVDQKVQVVLDAVKAAGQEENTVIILTSDHGDHGGSHKMEHKSTFYEESARIPFIVMHKGTAPAGQVDQTHLVSNGLDLLPTVCDYAGLPDAKADPRGRSLRPLVEGKEVADWRKTLGVESQAGQMVVGDRAKYIRYDVGKPQGQLLDLRKDPGETRHFTADPEHAELLQELKTAFDKDWFPRE